jgi:hypothetical protein
MKWQALTYAGHTAWGIHNERNGGAYNTGIKRKPARSEPRRAIDSRPDTFPRKSPADWMTGKGGGHARASSFALSVHRGLSSYTFSR